MFEKTVAGIGNLEGVALTAMYTPTQTFGVRLPQLMAVLLFCWGMGCSSSPATSTDAPEGDGGTAETGSADDIDTVPSPEEDASPDDATSNADVDAPDILAPPDDIPEPPPALVLSAEAHPINTLGALLTITSDTPGTPSVKAVSETHALVVPDSGLFETTEGIEFVAVILGMHADRDYTFEVDWTPGAGGSSTSHLLSWSSPPLPTGTPPIEVLVSEPDSMEPGVTLFSVTTSNKSIQGPPLSDIFMLDAAGTVVGHVRPPFRVSDLRQTKTGTLLVQNGTIGGIEWDLRGNVLHEWSAKELGTETMHHELFELEDGNLATLGTTVQAIGGYPLDETYNVVGDRVVTFSRSGEILTQFTTFDVLDPYRITDSFFITHWEDTYPTIESPRDWTHGNGVIHDPTDDTLVVSYRHQDAVFKHVRETGELLWVLGSNDPTTPGDDDWPFLTLVGEGSLPNHMHAPQRTPMGTWMLFDNGNDIGVSRTVEYAIDPTALTVEQLWEYIDPGYDPPLHSRQICDADFLTGGTVLITNGATKSGEAPNAHFWSLVTEVTHDAEKKKVFEVRIQSTQEPPHSHRVYRSERIPGLYPCTENPCEG